MNKVAILHIRMTITIFITLNSVFIQPDPKHQHLCIETDILSL